MRSPFTQLYVHLVWATWDRNPWITPAAEPALYAAITAKCIELKCKVIAIGGIEDHVHVLVRMPATLAVCDLVHDIKGSSSHMMTHAVMPNGVFKWQGAYGAFSISKTTVDRVVEYIRRQKEHHANRRLIDELEVCGAEYQGEKSAAGAGG